MAVTRSSNPKRSSSSSSSNRSNPRSRSSRKKLKSGGQFDRWSDLPIDIFGLISSRISGLADRIRFSSVCKHWRSASMLQPSSSWTWLVLSPDSDLSIYSFSDDAFYKLGIPEVNGAQICGSFENWVVVVNHPDSGNFLLNLFSRAKITLPHPIIRNPSCVYDLFVRKAIVSSSPATSDGSSVVVVAVINAVDDTLSICRLRQGIKKTWTSVPKVGRGLKDIIFYNGLLHCIDVFGYLYIIDVVGEEEEKIISSVKRFDSSNTALMDPYVCKYLVESGGRLLLVLRSGKFKRPWHPAIRIQFKVLVLESVGPPPIWVEVKSLGGHALFLGPTCSKSVLPRQYENDDVKEDCIYLSNGFNIWSETCLDSCVFSMVDGSITPIFDTTYKSRLRESFSRTPLTLWLHFNYDASSMTNIK